MTWDELEERLVAAFRATLERVLVVVNCRSNPTTFVQFAGREAEIYAEASEFLPSHKPDAATQLAAAGWTAAEPGNFNWHASLPLPALTTEYADLAHRCVLALRDGFDVPSPDDLDYRAWREPEDVPNGVTWTDERWDELDKGDPALQLDMLGLSRQP